MIILSVLSDNTVQCPKTVFVCLLYIYTFPIASFCFFVQWIDLGSKNPLQFTHSGYQDTKVFGTKVWRGSLDFNLGHTLIRVLKVFSFIAEYLCPFKFSHLSFCNSLVVNDFYPWIFLLTGSEVWLRNAAIQELQRMSK